MSETYVPGHQNNPEVLVFVNPSKFLGNQDAKILKMEILIDSIFKQQILRI